MNKVAIVELIASGKLFVGRSRQYTQTVSLFYNLSCELHPGEPECAHPGRGPERSVQGDGRGGDASGTQGSSEAAGGFAAGVTGAVSRFARLTGFSQKKLLTLQLAPVDFHFRRTRTEGCTDQAHARNPDSGR